MDIQKERDLYLAELLEREVITQYEFRDLVFKPEINAFDSNYLSSWFIDKINFGWSAWQAAKAQADQKVKLLLCDEHLKKCESPTGIFNSQYPDEEPCLICLAKEAKAQAVPEGFVAFPKKQTSRMRTLARDFDARLSLTKYEQLHNIWVKQAMIEAQELAND